jgi:hypothetical protein
MGVTTAESQAFADRAETVSLPALPLRPKALLAALVAVDVSLVIAHLAAVHVVGGEHGVGELFNLDAEQNVPTWFSTVQLAAVALLCIACSAIENRLTTRRLADRLGWLTLAGLFVVLSVEESVGLHERVSSDTNLVPVLNRVFGGEAPLVRNVFGHGYRYSWVVFYAPLILLAVIFLLRFATRHFRPQPHVRGALLTGTCLFILVIIAEALSKSQDEHPRLLNMLMIGEEFTEMLGATVFAFGFLMYLELLADRLLRNGPPDSASIAA